MYNHIRSREYSNNGNDDDNNNDNNNDLDIYFNGCVKNINYMTVEIGKERLGFGGKPSGSPIYVFIIWTLISEMLLIKRLFDSFPTSCDDGPFLVSPLIVPNPRGKKIEKGTKLSTT